MTPRELYGFLALKTKRDEAAFKDSVRAHRMAAHGDPQKMKRFLDESSG